MGRWEVNDATKTKWTASEDEFACSPFAEVARIEGIGKPIVIYCEKEFEARLDGSGFHWLIEAPTHPNDHPHLLVKHDAASD